MKANWKTIGIVAISAALLYYPTMKLIEYVKKRTKKETGEDGENSEHDHTTIKAFSPAYRVKRHPHHRHN